MNEYCDNKTAQDEAWSTREELLLVGAVNRHGTKNWDAVAMEVQSRIVSSFGVNPQTCQRRYYDLKRRFAREEREIPAESLLEELRRLRVDELRREVESCDVSITSLQFKVKRLEEDRERSTGHEENGLPNEEINAPAENSENRGVNRGGSGQSSNEPNSSAVKIEKIDQATAPGEEDKIGGEVSCGGSSDTVAKQEEIKILDGEGEIAPDLGESGESVAETRGEAAKDNSDVQSSASLSRWRRRRKPIRDRSLAESQPLVSFLELFRSHKYGSVFERRIKIQESTKYRTLIRQHVDLATVQRKLTEGRYATDAEFYRDLLLLCTNAAIFFPKASPESSAAVELRRLVRRQISSAIPHPSSSSSSPQAPLQQTSLIACQKSEKEVSEAGEMERAMVATTKKRRTATSRGGAAKRRDGGVLLESLKNPKKEIRAEEVSPAASVKRGVGRPPKRPPPGLLSPPSAKRRKAPPPQPRARKK